MNTEIKRKFKWFFVWQDRKQEEWLQRMSLNGWHLKSFSRFLFTFEKGPEIDYQYSLDYFNTTRGNPFSTSDEEIEDYKTLLEDAGWERIGAASGWQVLRRPAETEEKPPIYSDVESKIGHYRRIMWSIALSTPLFLVVFLGKFEVYPFWFQVLFLTVFITALLSGGINFLMILMRIRELKHQ